MDNFNLILQLHSPQELQYFSNLAHWAEGVLFIVIATLALVEVFGKLRSRRSKYLWPSILFLSGLLLPVSMIADHIGSQFKLALEAIFLIPEQRQHFFMAILLMIAGGAELLARKKYRTSNLLKLVFPVSFVIIGVLFLFHPQHGNAADMMRAVTIHRYLGLSIILVGLFKGLAEFFKVRQFTFVWILFIIISGSLLMTYREADMSYLADPSFQEMHINH